MILRPFHAHVTIAIIAALFGVFAGTVTLHSEPPNSQEVSEESLTTVLQKRRAVFEQLVKVQVAAFRSGKVGRDAVAHVHERLLSAELELAATREERIKVLEAVVTLRADWEKFVHADYEAAKATLADTLEAQAAHLEAQANLLREQLKR